MKKLSALLLLSGLMVFSLPVSAQKKKKQAEKEMAQAEDKEKDHYHSGTLSGLEFRSIGPALTSGRVSDFAVNPQNPSEYYVATASGGVWKTENAGTSYRPIFDRQGSYSIGVVSMAPSNPHVIWVGTGENNGQRSVGYGDGVYKSVDGGKSWKHMGLKESEHIGTILIHPKDENVVWVAAQGPLWSAGGDRGIYKTVDGGKNWNKVLEISEHTGANEIVMDPRDPDVLYASVWQRRRHVWTFLGGGPESGLYKSTDGGESWEKSQQGLPGGDLGRIGLAISPVNPDVIFAIAEASGESGGVFRSSNRGASWEKRGGYTTSGNYYQEIICDLFDVDRLYSMNTFAMVSNDGGKSWSRLGEKSKHVDNHCMWLDPQNSQHYLMGCDGGIYETWDAASTWHYKPNLPITQFYKVATDNAEPFYFVYGGTQDNFSLGGPSRTTSNAGIVNADWFVTNGGDGFESQIDPTNPNIIYAQAQYGYLVRFDKQSGESVFIQPQPGKDEAAFRWNWDAPLIISPHNPQRIYFAANKLFKSDDRGNSWQSISPDLSRQLDRNQLPVMDKVWSMDAVAKNRSTSIYGNIVALSESPLSEGLLYVGTDDGLIHVSDNDGGNWRKIDQVGTVPERTYVNMLLTSQHDANTVYAVFNNHKNGDFKPYVYKSTDQGMTWTAITADLPERGSVYCIAEDHVDPNLLFVGTEFGVFVTRDGGQKWLQLKAGLPTIAIRDMEIQKRENDLVLASFGRGFYILDDYTPLRQVKDEVLAQEAHIFPIKDALMFVPSRPIGGSGSGFLGESYFRTENPPIGVVFSYYFKEPVKDLKALRKEKEKEAEKAGEPISYPSFEEMRAEDNEEKSYLIFTILDQDKQVINRIKSPIKTGIQRLVWDMRFPSSSPVRLGGGGRGRFGGGSGPMVPPGEYAVSLAKSVRGEITELVEAQPFVIKLLENTTLPTGDRKAVVAFQTKVNELRRAVGGAVSLHGELENKLKHIKEAIILTPSLPADWTEKVMSQEARLRELAISLQGDRSVSRREFETLPSISSRLGSIVFGTYYYTGEPTQTQRESYEIAAEAFEPVYEGLKTVVKEIRELEKKLEDAGAPYTPGRTPVWNRE